mgnify:CR=1 FL=1
MTGFVLTACAAVVSTAASLFFMTSGFMLACDYGGVWFSLSFGIGLSLVALCLAYAAGGA